MNQEGAKMGQERKVLWSGRFGQGAADETLAFTSSLMVDKRLARYDILGSLAHARMLTRQGIIAQEDGERIAAGLKELYAKAEEGALEIDPQLEDVHSNIEFLLTSMIEDAGARLHTGRSRNDQVATDLRMWQREAILDTIEAIHTLEHVLMERASDNVDVILPGFTHVQHAQPISLAHHLMAHFHRLARDVERFAECYRRTNISPLGSAALAGTTYNIDRLYTSELLAFKAPCANSLDGVSDRDFVAEYLFAASLCAVHLSSLCEELVYWSSPEFGFVEMDDAYATGSSIMPQKKNPDVAELIRGRAGATIGDLLNMLVTLKSLPLSYNRDLQEDKAALFAAHDRIVACLRMAAAMVSTVKFNKERMLAATKDGFLNATDLADYLVTRGLPFRKAHEVVGAAVRYCIEQGKRLEELTLEELRSFSDLVEEDVFSILPIERCVLRRMSVGGTSPNVIPMQFSQGMSALQRQSTMFQRERARLQTAYRRLLE
ncbi:MAG TPA: argininosuccinate lyase [Methanomassiliicoccaceae archaeon]|nr:argininosuccinate lyase [Methanomassiliicoccaceae archaeon]